MHVRMIVRYTLVVFNVRCLFFHIHYCSLLQLLWWWTCRERTNCFWHKNRRRKKHQEKIKANVLIRRYFSFFFLSLGFKTCQTMR